jgi:phenylalanyl-tRNA synthetase beta chain
MNISYNWLKQYINTDLPAVKIAEVLTSTGLECGSVSEYQSVKGGLEGLVVGEVIECEQHPDADRLRVTKTNIGTGEALQIVCGAPNCRAGLKVVVATIGTKLYSGEESFAIKRSKIRGVESQGMLCAEDEIGIGESHDGIIELPADTPVGTLVKDFYQITSDSVIEVDITPNRIDGASHYGVARDLAAALQNQASKHKTQETENAASNISCLKSNILIEPSIENFKIDNNDLPFKVTVENADACPRYSGIAIAGITVKESPAWLQNYLKAVGSRPINNVVDVTNFILLGLGQPLHAFDADKIPNHHVIVKTLQDGTKFTTLDGAERTLHSDDLMICSEEGGMCIGGVFGGLSSGVTENTKNVFLESAYFNPVSIRKTARRHGLNTDASFRYERGIDPNKTVFNLKVAAQLIKEVAGGTISCEVIDVYPQEIKPFDVTLSFDKINTLIGKEIPKETVKSILKSLEIEIVSENETEMQLAVPTYRVDVQRDVDVIEDILRIYGYNNITPGTDVRSSLTFSQKPDSHRLQNLVSEQLGGYGFNEILNNSLTRAAYYSDLTSFPEKNAVRLLNPLSADLSVMRQTLLFGGLESIAYNANRRNANLRFYEFGNCYYYNDECRGRISSTQDEEGRKCSTPTDAYSENFHLGLWVTGNRVSQSWLEADEKSSIYELKAYVENILRRLGFDLRKLSLEEFSDDLLSSAISVKTRQGETLAVYGMVAKKQRKAFDIDNDVFFADLYWNNLLTASKNHKIRFSELSKYPEVKRDLALLLDKNISFAEIERLAYKSESKLLKSVNLFDVYEGKNLEEGKKSYAIGFTLQDETATLTDTRIDAVMKKFIKAFEDGVGAKLR